jgi:hypothetical protein
MYLQTKSSILQIFEDKFDPFDLYIQSFSFSVPSDAIDDEFFMTKGKLGTRERLGSLKDLGSVKRLAERIPPMSRSFPILKSMALLLPYWTFTHRFSGSTILPMGSNCPFGVKIP